jgi:O-antigen/teichoic acid export membrane protein
MFLLNGSQMLRANADPLLVGALIGPFELGVYVAAVRTATLVSFVLTITSMVAQPNLSAFHVGQRKEELEQFFATATRLTFVLSVAGAVILCIAGPIILRLFGQAFTAGYPTLLILLAGHVAAARLGPVTSLLVMTGYQRTAASIHTGATLFSALLLIALIVPFGVIGAAVAVAVSAFSTQLALYFVARRRLDVHLRPLSLRGLVTVKVP